MGNYGSRWIWILLTAVIIHGTAAGQATGTGEEALRMMNGLYAREGKPPIQEMRVEKIWMYESDTAIILYTPTEGAGFVLLSFPNGKPGLLAYATEGRLSGEELPPGFLWLTDAYLKDFRTVAEGNSLITSETPDTPEEDTKSTLEVFPLLTSTWDQRCLYNDSCPADATSPAYFCGRAPAGCVATTLAQIMKYHKWPLQGTGVKSYYSIKYGTLSANFGATQYQIQSLPDAIYTPHAGIARLLYHAGIASQMNFGPLASGTGITDAHNALVSYFGYKNTAQVVTKSSYTEATWKALMRSEIDAGRPVFYSGIEQTGGGGHAWVLDGYSGNDFFHCNWGWSGIANGYFTLANLNPLGSANYVNYQEAIIGIEPAGTPPLASFSASKCILEKGDSISFVNLSSAGSVNFQWIFPGGVPASWQGAITPKVTYPSGGVFDVILIAGNGLTYDTMHRIGYLRVLPIAGFSASRTVTEAGGSVDFSDATESSVPMQAWEWHFFGGQPTVSTQKNPTGIVYPQPGQYAVFLKVSGGNQSDSQMVLQYITVHQQCDTLLDFFMPGWNVQPVNQPAFQMYQEDLDGLTPYHSTYITSGWQYYTETGGNQFVSATSLFTSPGTANNWYIFGPVTLPSGGAQLSWRHKFPDHTKRDGYEIKVSTTGYTHQYFTGSPLFSLADNDPYTLGDTVWRWNYLQIPSAPYGGQPCWIGVHHYATNMFYLAFDDFRITSCNGFPLTADLFSFDTLIAAGDTVLFYDFSTGDPLQVTWSFPGGVLLNPGAKHPMVKYPNPGTFDAGITAQYGSGSQSKTYPGYIQVKPAGVHTAVATAKEAGVYPNPVRDRIWLQGIAGPTRFIITDPGGRILLQGTVNPDESIGLEQIPRGVSFLLLQTESQHHPVFKIVKL